MIAAEDRTVKADADERLVRLDGSEIADSDDDEGLIFDGVLHPEGHECEACAALTPHPISCICTDCRAEEERALAEEDALALAEWDRLSAKYEAESEAELTAWARAILRVSHGTQPEEEEDAESAPVLDPLAAYEVPLDGSAYARVARPLLQRNDGEPLFYEGKLNWLFGTPGTGKSWVALCAMQATLERGGRVIYWDHEDRASTLLARARKLGIDLTAQHREGQVRYMRPGLADYARPLGDLLDWLTRNVICNPLGVTSLVVIDSAESAGCPSDGTDVAPWIAKMLLPFMDFGVSVLVLDHVPKRKEGRPLGPIGSQHKLARVDGAALLASGVPWTQKSDGYVTLTNHKDRQGGLPAPTGKPVARIVGTHEGANLTITIVPPDAEDNPEEAFAPTLRALAERGESGVHGHRAMRNLVSGRTQQRDKTIALLVTEGLISKEKDGKKLRYRLTAVGRELLQDEDEDVG